MPQSVSGDNFLVPEMSPAQQKQAGGDLPAGACCHVTAQSQHGARGACGVSAPYQANTFPPILGSKSRGRNPQEAAQV